MPRPASTPHIALLTAALALGACPASSFVFAAEQKPAPVAAAAPAIAPGVEFAGYTTIGQEQLFALYDPAAQAASPWLKRGQMWQGYTVQAFDSTAETLSLRHDRAELKLTLRTARTQTTGVVLSGLVKGSYTLLDGTILYSDDAQLRLGPDFLVSSPTGLMVSDHTQSVVGGDLKVETERGTLRMQDGLLEVRKGMIVAKGPVTLTITPKDPDARPIVLNAPAVVMLTVADQKRAVPAPSAADAPATDKPR